MSTDLDGRDVFTLSSVSKYWSMSFLIGLKPISDVLDTHTHTQTHRQRIFLEIVKHRNDYFLYKLLKLLTLERGNCEQFLESIV